MSHTEELLESLMERIARRSGYLDDQTLTWLAQLDRLHPVLVRCSGARFTCPAQDAARLVALVESGGESVRDVRLATL